MQPEDPSALRAAAQAHLDADATFACGFRALPESLAAPRGAPPRAAPPSAAPRWFHARRRRAAGPGAEEIQGIVADIGRQKRAESERSDPLRRRVAAQKDVERRIALDLHD